MSSIVCSWGTNLLATMNVIAEMPVATKEAIKSNRSGFRRLIAVVVLSVPHAAGSSTLSRLRFQPVKRWAVRRRVMWFEA